MQVVPNPFSDETTFRIQGLNTNNAVIKIYNQLGAAVDEIKLNGTKTEYVYRNQKLAKGVYHYILSAEGKNLKAGKLVVE